MNLKELSKQLGLSQTTVSRAINGYPEVSEETRLRVLQAAERHNYRPNMRAKGLATGRAMSIGHVLPISTRHEIVNPIFADFIAGAGETYSRHSYQMILSVVDDLEEEAAYRNLASLGAVDGVVIHGPRTHDGRIALMHSLGLPFVVHGRATGVEQDYSWLDINNRSAFRRATQFLLDLGHRHIALLNGIETMDFALRRKAGFLEAIEGAGLTPDTSLMFSSEMTESLGYGAAMEFLSRPAPPTAFLVSSMISAIGVRRALVERGLTMGRDVSIVIHDDMLSYLDNAGEVPIFTATRSSVREAGRLLARMLLERIEAPDTGHQHRLLEADLVIGQSTGPAP